MNAGGKGANQAVAAARMGANVTFVTKVGNDIFGEQSIAGFKKERINTDFVFVDDSSSTGTALIVVNKEGENSIVVAPGANARLLPRDIDQVHDFEEAGIILIQLEIPMETISAVVKKALVNNQKVIINPRTCAKTNRRNVERLILNYA
jgi:ribokinase